MLDGIIGLAAPLLTVIIGIIALVVDLGQSTPEKRRLLPILSIVGLALVAAVSYVTTVGRANVAAGDVPTFFGGSMVADHFGGFFTIALCVVAALALAMSDRYLEEKHLNQGEFYALILFSGAGAMVMAHAYDLVNVFVGLEVLSVALYILSGFARRERRSEESAVKYFLLGSFASAFLVFGTALVYGAVGIALQGRGIAPVENTSYTNFQTIAFALQATGGNEASLAASPLFVMGVALLIVGLGFKASIVPFHSYAPDVYEGAPTSVTAFMSAGAKIGAFAALVRLFQALLQAEGSEPFRIVLWLLAAATMLVGNILAVRQTSIKRMLAYSSIAHAGYILVGVLASGTLVGGSPVAADSARQAILYYLFIYSFMNLGAFALIIWLGRDGGEYTQVREYAGLAKRQPLAALVMAIFMLSLAGIPPAAGFFGKLYLFMSALQAGYVGLAVLGLVVSAIGVFYYLNIIVQMYFREPEHDFSGTRAGGAKWAAIVSAGAIVLFGLFPTLIISPRVTTSDTMAPAEGSPMPLERPAQPAVGEPEAAEALPPVGATPDANTPIESAPETNATPSPSAQPVAPVPSSTPAAAPTAAPATAP